MVFKFTGPFDTTRDYTLQYTVTHISVLTSTLVTVSSEGLSSSTGLQNCPRASATATLD
jgi:hypothetical protein